MQKPCFVVKCGKLRMNVMLKSLLLIAGILAAETSPEEPTQKCVELEGGVTFCTQADTGGKPPKIRVERETCESKSGIWMCDV
jgi:hypothetical protein